MNNEELYATLKSDMVDKIHFLEDKPEETPDSTLKALCFKAAGIPKSAVEAVKFPVPELTSKQQSSLQQLVKQRLNGTPLAHLTGLQNFMGIEFIADKRALIPRRETEILGRKALELCREIASHHSQFDIMDLCCGSGNLGISIANSIPNVTVFSSDLSEEAVELTRENSIKLNLTNRVQAKASDMFSIYESAEFYNRFELIVCNPPYISSAKVVKMDTEIAANEPSLAFDGGMLGTKIIQTLIREAPRFLKPNGWVIFEVGVGQGAFISQLCQKTELYQTIDTVLDAQGNIRVIFAKTFDNH